ncbi:MAG: sensor histidine kinase [Spirochaetia bacterium]
MQDKKKQTLFIADDNPENLNVLSEILEEEGYETRASLSGEEMLSSIGIQKPDMIILDIHMPKMDGYEICKELKASEETKEIPVIFCSALTEPFNIVRGFELGAVDYITKPFRSQEVLARVKTHLELQNKQTELEKSLEYLKSAQKHLIQTEKMTSIGILLAGIAHEINNPVNYIINSLEGFRTDFTDIKKLLDFCTQTDISEKAEYAENLRTLLNSIEYPVLIQEMEALLGGIYTGAKKVHEIVKSLKAFSLSGEEPKQVLSVESEIDRALLMLQPQVDENIKVVKTLTSPQEVMTQPGSLSQVALQILQNSLDAVRRKSKAEEQTISIAIESGENRESVITISDTGPGMDKEAQHHALDPFFTTKKIGHGTGLGLTTAYQIVKETGGTVEIESETDKGTTVRIILPPAV